MGAFDKKVSPFQNGSKRRFLSRTMIEGFEAAEIILGYPRHSLTIMQGSYSTDVPESKGTHDKSGVADLTAFQVSRKMWVLRLLGFPGWHRRPFEGFDPHLHVITRGDHGMGNVALQQSGAYTNGRNGLASNLKDPFKRPRNTTTRFVQGARKGQWIANRANFGHTEPGTIAAATRRKKRPKGFVIRNIATVRCGKVDYLVTEKGTFFRKSYFNSYVGTDFITKTERWTVAKTPCIGRIEAGAHAEPKARIGPRPKGFFIKSEGYTKVGSTGNKYVVTPSGTWYQVSLLTPFEPAPKPKPRTTPTARTTVTPRPTRPQPLVATPPLATSFNAILVTQNVIRWRLNSKNTRGVADFKQGKDYADRCILMAKMLEGREVSLAATQEAGQFVDGDLYAKALGDVMGQPFDNVLHGDAAGDITQAVAWDTTRFSLVREGSVETVGPDHNTVTWVHLKHAESGIEFLQAVPHLDFRTGATADKNRQQQTLVGIDKVEAEADGLPILWVGDFNSSKEKAFDGPGKAFASRGYTDAEDTACPVVNPTFNSYNDLTNPSIKRSRQLDRLFVKTNKVDVRRREIILNLDSSGNHRRPWPSDHQPLLFEIAVHR